jgi:hypothetical protein
MTENVGNDFFPWEDIADGNVFESGIYLMEISKFDDGYAGTGKRMPKAMFKCLEPAQFKNMAYFENYVVGTEEDPTSIVPGTMGARSMKQVFVAAQVPKGNSMTEIMMNSIGNQLLLQLNKYKEVGGEYDGQDKNKVVGMFKIGERPVGLSLDKKKGAAANSGGPKPLGSSAPALPSSPATLICTSCGKAVPKAEYSAHVESCAG